MGAESGDVVTGIQLTRMCRRGGFAGGLVYFLQSVDALPRVGVDVVHEVHGVLGSLRYNNFYVRKDEEEYFRICCCIM